MKTLLTFSVTVQIDDAAWSRATDDDLSQGGDALRRAGAWIERELRAALKDDGVYVAVLKLEKRKAPQRRRLPGSRPLFALMPEGW